MGNTGERWLNPSMTFSPSASFKPQPPRNATPRYRVVKQTLQKMIEIGQYTAGSVLPSETLIASGMQVSIGTLRRAVDELVHEHVLVRRQGKGTFVASHSPARFMFQFFHVEPHWDFGDDEAMRLQTPAEYPDIECLSFATGRANASQASALRIKPGDGVIAIENRLLLGQRVVMHDQIYVSSAVFKNLNEKTFTQRPGTIYSLYQTDFGITVLRTLERARALGVDASSAKILGLAAGTPVMQIHRLALTFGDRPVEYRVSTLNTQTHDYVSASPAPASG
jgi:GntR family transcriptional regulator